MGVWIFMLLMDLVIPLTMIGFGTRFARRPPDRINAVFGYRTRRSMRSTDAWRFAHGYFGTLWRTLGWVLLPLSVLPMLLVLGKDEQTIGWTGSIVMFAQMIALIAPIFPTERALKRRFEVSGE
jgi:hypothetical protein